MNKVTIDAREYAALKKHEDEIRELKRDLENMAIHRDAAVNAHVILSKGIKQALGLKNWPDFYKLYGDGLFATGVVRYLLEHVKLKKKPVEEPLKFLAMPPKVFHAAPEQVLGKGPTQIIDAPPPKSNGGRPKRGRK